ncbi:hypothetical protein BKG83_22645 [Mycobacteroides chelonae]|jgi:hypothetical protein|uniref:Uncharacterized protein n=1 Tax=Mycobacteroides chelonae TaxID=1774 RepID=A0A1S1LT70_MYCCH|nr:hypothetical protein [Mycobacteroides chelonae]AMW20091.1 hypothetical protein Chelonae_p2340 [Mycobacterium sp. QIA-37]PKQ57433.1 hypothetical protein B5566_13870 [Mycobacterium sp. MHSD3]SKL73906.1 Uncharacterised protein [Mycobacteroides abscessus subsp. bolletii]MBF9521612.1 hypothetical protein [Mycobacteroides chelonae]OHU50075.1 hypothetical protein BKG83_22645 [Mycobacteroides chelonae]
MTDESQDEADRNDRANTSTPNKYATLPPPIDLSKTIASKDVSLAQVEQADAPDWNQGADPYLRIEGWKRP